MVVPVLHAQATQPSPAPPATIDPVLELAHEDAAYGSSYIPLDSWIYPAMMRLQGLGFADSAFLGLRPWTRLSVANMLAETSDKLNDQPSNEEAWSLFQALTQEITPDLRQTLQSGHVAKISEVYTRVLGIGGTPLRDSFHLGQTLINDYGRPYQQGFNNVTGLAGRATWGRFSFDARGELQYSPSGDGYSPAVAQTLSAIDGVPYGPNPGDHSSRARSLHVPTSAWSKQACPPTCSATSFPLARPMSGWGRRMAAAWPGATTRKTSILFA